jgi:Fe-S-cluster containining protein
MTTRRVQRNDLIKVGKWKVEGRLAMARVEGRGPLSVADECGGHCCRHGVYVSLPERDRILEYADRIQEVMDGTQTTDTDQWFERQTHEDEDFPGGLCVGAEVYDDKCAFLNREGLCVLQLLEPTLKLSSRERLKPFYCRLFPLTTWCDRVEFDDLCDGVRPCCTLASDGDTRAVEAYAAEFTEVLGGRGYKEFLRTANQLDMESEMNGGVVRPRSPAATPRAAKRKKTPAGGRVKKSRKA